MKICPIRPPRPTQEERRTATREALLDATIECLVELGYAATTTRVVSERAGVSQGAQQHHFRSKAALVDAAISRLAQQMAMRATAEPVRGVDERDRAGVLLDRLWKTHSLPESRAFLEFCNAARTDAEVAPRVAQTHAQSMGLMKSVARSLLPTLSTKPGFDDWLLVCVATVRGTAVLGAIPGVRGEDYAAWPTVRRHLLLMLDRVITPARATKSAV